MENIKNAQVRNKIKKNNIFILMENSICMNMTFKIKKNLNKKLDSICNLLMQGKKY
jgi:hypothetical protein